MAAAPTTPPADAADTPSTNGVLLDTSALLAIVTDGPHRSSVIAALDRYTFWCASDLALAEGVPAIDRLTEIPIHRHDIEDALHTLWSHLYAVPVDQHCLQAASTLARSAPARICDAIHIAAATLLPGPPQVLTLDPAQGALAEHVGLAVVDLDTPARRDPDRRGIAVPSPVRAPRSGTTMRGWG